MIVINETRETVVAKNVWAAGSFWERLRGLIGSPPLEENEGFLIPSCQGIHSFGMSYLFDAIYLDRNGRVLELIIGMKPNSFGIINFKTRSVLELPHGTIDRTKTQKDDLLFVADISSLATSHESAKKILSILPPVPRML